MAIRNVRIEGDPILRKKSRVVEKIDDRLKVLIDDMIDTMREEDGVGLAAPQVGILRRVVVIDVGQGLLRLINPEIIYQEGEAIDVEGCLSVPDRSGKVKRPRKVKVKYMDINGEEKVIEGEGLLARALCHETDHLNGILYIDKLFKE
ncbi:peptide deformylase [Clostridiisalibacter paucivorans]|uniref:peptide deformylase n=1 Tax=Clostridiisalibacter paucivorans TaxID=408753 RepID=UPI00047A5833|nr:peptide deformylase [Clostridiisalibacter paucivorans]